jgi:protoporphyrinogen oxidase
MHVALIGAGVSGLSCAIALSEHGVDCTAWEREHRVGGHARTDQIGAFRFDQGPHVLLGIPDEVRPLFDDVPLVSTGCSSTIHFEKFGGVPAPVQDNLACLPWPVRLRCLAHLALARSRGRSAPRDQRELLEAMMGRALVDLFFEGYSSKRLLVPLAAQQAECVDGRVRRISLRESLRHALWARRGRPGFDSSFFYPRDGGMEQLPNALLQRLPPRAVRLGAELVELDVFRKKASFADGRHVFFDALVSSLPLCELLALAVDLPPAIAEAGRSLGYTSTYVVNLGFDRPLGGPHGIVRFPDPSVPFYRLSFPASYAPSAVPPGCDAVVAEVSHHCERRPLGAAEAVARVREGLVRLGVAPGDARPVVEHVNDITVSHVIRGPSTAAMVTQARAWLEEHDVYTCGKYGQWEELLMPQSMLAGKRIAERIVARARAAPPAREATLP